jgi:hypothetical protein
VLGVGVRARDVERYQAAPESELACAPVFAERECEPEARFEGERGSIDAVLCEEYEGVGHFAEESIGVSE